MINTKNLLVITAFAAATVGHAEIVKITVTGTVGFNVIQGSMAGVPTNSPVVMSFNVDSDTFLNSASFPTRGYNVIDSSFSMTVDGRPVSYDMPQPDPVYFVLRNNDPAVDGVFLSYGTDLDVPINVHIPGLAPTHELNYLHTFSDNTTFNSLNIVDAVGTYNLETNISSFNWSIGRFGNAGAEYNPVSMTIESVPEPTTMAILGLGLLAAARKRKK